MIRWRPDRVFPVALLSGLALALAFPRFDVGFLAWFALAPLFAVMERRPFGAGFAAGTAFFGVILYWVNIVMTTYGGMHPFFSGVAYLLLVFYLALYFGATTWLCCRLRRLSGIPFWFSLPAIWIAAEYLRSLLLSGFPWASLGYSQHNEPHLLQSADLFGVYGIGFLVVFFNAALASAWRGWREKSGFSRALRPLLLALILVAAAGGYGRCRLSRPLDERPRQLSVVLVQGNVDQSIKWDPTVKQATVARYRQLSLAAAGAGETDLIVWPESATPFYFDFREPLLKEVMAIPPETDAQLLFGAPAYEFKEGGVRYLNSAFLLSRKGEVLGRSDKIHLVPFGEYNPLERVLPFLGKLVQGVGDFSPGVLKPLPLEAGTGGVLVCFEAIFPEIARDYVRLGCGLLINITNDAWFGRSSAPYQHLAMTRFRAVENRVWVVRAANTGISAVIAPSGRITEATGLFETATLRSKVGFGVHPTFYNGTGDLIPLLLLGCSLLVWAGVEWRARHQKAGPGRGAESG
ncbi:MAG: apolipoprotein N-acyltransferase [Deltaproteobacteria bacterium]|nr:apolipoprotein N-acyltransferase [Deltaproteobacteria bacterium]